MHEKFYQTPSDSDSNHPNDFPDVVIRFDPDNRFFCLDMEPTDAAIAGMKKLQRDMEKDPAIVDVYLRELQPFLDKQNPPPAEQPESA